MKKASFEDFVAKARDVHGLTYEYPPQAWAGYRSPVEVVCPRHGVFKPKAHNHVAGTGCPACAAAARVDGGRFLDRVRALHPGLDFSESVYLGAAKPISFKCPEHGLVRRRAAHLLTLPSGCPQCGVERGSGAKRLDESLWLERFRRAHGDTYGYLRVFWRRQARVVALCPDHGEFESLAKNHANGAGCPECGREKITGRPGLGSEWAARAAEVHGGKYTYGEALVGRQMSVTCPQHGTFLQNASDHVSGHGCSSCAAASSRGQKELTQYCRNMGLEVRENYRFAGKKEVDIFLPAHGLAIEYDGLWWHAHEQRGRLNILRKQRLAESAGIRTIHVFEDEWVHRRHVIEKIIACAVGRVDRIHARDCSIDLAVPDDEAIAFYDENHVQGRCTAGVHVGLRRRGDLVFLLTLTPTLSARGRSPTAQHWELRRMASTHLVVGGASRAFHAAVGAHPNVDEVVSYSDDRMFRGRVYEHMGFSRAGYVRPDYYYVRPGEQKRHRKGNFTRDRLARSGSFDPNLTERENMQRAGWRRIYDCGKTRWVWRRNIVVRPDF